MLPETASCSRNAPYGAPSSRETVLQGEEPTSHGTVLAARRRDAQVWGARGRDAHGRRRGEPPAVLLGRAFWADVSTTFGRVSYRQLEIGVHYRTKMMKGPWTHYPDAKPLLFVLERCSACCMLIDRVSATYVPHIPPTKYGIDCEAISRLENVFWAYTSALSSFVATSWARGDMHPNQVVHTDDANRCIPPNDPCPRCYCVSYEVASARSTVRARDFLVGELQSIADDICTFASSS